MSYDDECAGLFGGCPECRDIWLTQLRELTGDEPRRGLCVVCMIKHWPWEQHQGKD